MSYTWWTREAFKRAAKRGSKSKTIPYYYRKKYGKKKAPSIMRVARRAKIYP